jgi:hypothetical protein
MRLDHWRCWWSRPFGHLWEVITYFDGVSGRWAAFSRCARCDRIRGLAVGAPTHGAVFANQPLATGESQQGTKRSAPPSATPTTGAPRESGEFAEVQLERALRLYVRRARVSHALHGERVVYVAEIIGERSPRAASRNLRKAVARTTRGRVEGDAVERALRQLEHELE